MGSHKAYIFLLFFAFTLCILVPFSAATPTPAAGLQARDTIPGPPPDPLQKPGDGSGEWHAIWFCDAKDVLVHTELLGGIGDFVGQKHFQAARNMAHYLGDTGLDLNENVANMMKDTPEFKTAVLTLAHDWAAKTAPELKSDGTKTFVSPWTVWQASDMSTGKQYNLDWYYAMGDYSYSVSGAVTLKSGKMSLQWVAHIFDRYNWDNSTKTQCFLDGKFCINHQDVGHLHKCGWAHEYVNRGSSTVQTVANFNPKVGLPEPDLSGYGNWWDETPWVDLALLGLRWSVLGPIG